METTTLALHLGLVISPHPLEPKTRGMPKTPHFSPWDYGNDGWRWTQWIPTIFIVPICPNYTRNPYSWLSWPKHGIGSIGGKGIVFHPYKSRSQAPCTRCSCIPAFGGCSRGRRAGPDLNGFHFQKIWGLKMV